MGTWWVGKQVGITQRRSTRRRGPVKQVSDIFPGQLALIYIHAVVPTVLLVKVV